MISQKKILVVEDNEINRAMLKEMLSKEYCVLEAENGQEALAVVEKYKNEISLILLDIVMPVMDGYTFLSILKQDPIYSTIPVIVETQSDGESDEVVALSKGASDFVAKPYKQQIILHRVANIINLRETAAIVNQIRYDRLTGLYSKEFFYQRVRNILSQNTEKKYDIVCSDIVNFKLFNDIYGVPAGDRLLKGIAELYLKYARDDGICSHFAADQFACLVEHYDHYNDEFFIQLHSEIHALPNCKNVTIKWGIYTIEDPSVSIEQMCDRAILAARSIKDQYKTYFAAYDDNLRNILLREQAITDIMESALAQEQFVIYLQPKYRIKDNSLAGAEALVRWNHPEWGFMPPSEFIPLFEKNGFITKLDQYVWDKTCEILNDMEMKGYAPIPISVNVSRADIYNSDIPEILLETVNKYDLPPSRLHLEITESAYTENPKQIVETVGYLRRLGFVVEMDDFGSGYSSLNMLNQLPMDILKLDMEFIRSETSKPADEGILRFVMGIARLMDLSVVAEGVETYDQLERLKKIDCDYVQGYYFARPMPCEDFEDLVSKECRPSEFNTVEKSVGPEQSKFILIVADEDREYRDEVRKTFKDQYEVVETTDANSLLAFITGNEPKIAAIILSMTLSKEEGPLILKTLQKEKMVWRIPVIGTGPSDELCEGMALRLGADDYAGKPHLQSSLYTRVQRSVEVSRFWQQERSLRDESYKDYVTGVLNHWGFDYAVSILTHKDAPYALYVFHLDNLEQINDTYGNKTAKQTVICLASLLRSYTRETDILSRFYGNEFVAIVKRMESETIALQKGSDICDAVRKNPSMKKVSAAVSAGLVMGNFEEPMDKLIEKAEAALQYAIINNPGGCSLWEAFWK